MGYRVPPKEDEEIPTCRTVCVVVVFWALGCLTKAGGSLRQTLAELVERATGVTAEAVHPKFSSTVRALLGWLVSCMLQITLEN